MKKIILLSIGLLLFFIAGVSGQYFYFTGNSNGNGFQQGCTETYDINYTYSFLSSVGSKSVYINANLGKPLLIYSDNVYPFNLHAGTNLAIDSRGYQDTPKQIMSCYIKGEKDGSPLPEGNRRFGYITFEPSFSGNDYTGYMYLIYNTGTESNRVALIVNGVDVINSGQQYAHLTGSFRVVRLPCSEDDDIPTIKNVQHYTNSAHLEKANLVFDITDDGGLQNIKYVYNENNEWTGNKWNMNNQVGIDTSTVKVHITGKNRAGASVDKILSGSDISCVQKAGTPMTWSGWKIRDYTCTISSGTLFPGEFGVEDKITLTIDGSDRESRDAVQKVYTFNSGAAPYKVNNSPTGTDISVDSKIRFTVRDDWAGIDSGNIVAKVTAGTKVTVYTGNVNTGEMKLTLLPGGSEGLGNAAGYSVEITPKEYLPASTQISVNITFKDLKGYSSGYTWNFTTRPKCSALSCCDGTILYTGLSEGMSYTGEILYISGGNNVEVTIETGYEYNETLTGLFLVINCNYVGSTLFEGTPDDENPEELGSFNDEVTFSGDNTIYGILSGNVLTFSRWIDSAEVQQISPLLGDNISTRQVPLEWSLSWVDNYDWLSGFVVIVYTGNNPDNIITGSFVNGDLTGYSPEIPDGDDYYWSIYTVDNAGITGGVISTGSFSVEVNYLVDAITITPIYPTGDINTGVMDFVWETGGIITEAHQGTFSGFMVSLYSGDEAEPFWTGWTTGTGVTGPVLDNGSYNWYVSVVDEDGKVNRVGPQGFNVQLERTYIVKVEPGGRETCTANCDYQKQHSGYIRIFSLSGLNISSGYISLSGISYSGLDLPNGMYEIEPNTFDDEDLVLFKYVNPGIYEEYTGYIMSDKNNNVLLSNFATGKYLLYNDSGKIIFENFAGIVDSDEVYSGKVNISLGGTGSFTGMLPYGDYIVFYKGESWLSSFITDFHIDSSVDSFDFTTGDKLYNVYYKEGVAYQIPGDIYDAVGNINSYVDVDDVGYIISIIGDYPGTAVLAISGMKLNLDGDKTIGPFDIGVVLGYLPNLIGNVYMPYYDPFLRDAGGFYISDGFMNNIIWRDWDLD